MNFQNNFFAGSQCYYLTKMKVQCICSTLILFLKKILGFLYMLILSAEMFTGKFPEQPVTFSKTSGYLKEVSCLLVLTTPCLFHFNKKWNKKENKHEGIQISAFLLELMNELLEVYGESLVSFEFTTINLNLSLKLNLKSSLRLSLNWIWV